MDRPSVLTSEAEGAGASGCDHGRVIGGFELVLVGIQGSYTVPSDPPASIELRAVAVDARGRRGEDVVTLVTEQAWTGRIESRTTRTSIGDDFSGSCTDAWTIDLSFRTAADGTITGDAAAVLADGPTCSFPFDVSQAAQRLELGVGGSVDDDVIRLRLEHPAGFQGGVVVAGLGTLYLEGSCAQGMTTPGPVIELTRSGDTVDADFELSAMLACAGSARDVFTSTNTIHLERSGK